MRDFFPLSLQTFALRMLCVLFLMTLTRIIFYIFNSESFIGIGLNEWISGLWFDSVTVGLVYLPFFIFSTIPHPFRKNGIYRFIQAVTYIVPLLLTIGLNLLDTAYFHFTQKRSTIDLFSTFATGNDIGQLLTSFIADYWHLILAFIILIIGVIWMYRKTNISKNASPTNYLKETLFFCLLLPLYVLLGRGGLAVHKPLTTIDATLFTSPEYTSLVLNSAFTMVKSYEKDDLQDKNYYSEEQLDLLYSPIQTSQPQHLLPNKTNVVIILLESFGNEWVGSYSNNKGYTPFLDSLVKVSWSFKNGFSNGKKSIEAVPSIIGSLPSLMDNPYISSPYGGNQVAMLPTLLKKEGYSSAFFHGATNGSMRFNSFAKQAGFEQYFGRFEYNNDAHFDKTWGILDEYFNPWTARKISELKAPFVASLFTLSSHHPYYIPPHWKGKLKKGPLPICSSIHYGDVSLRKFFEQAEKESWYKNTIFVLVADHTASTNDTYYNQRSQMYRIPILFFDPSGKLPRRQDNAIFQQIDIMPTVLDLLNIETKYVAFGNSYFSKNPREAISYIEGSYHYFNGENMLVFANEKPLKMVNYLHSDKEEIDSMALLPKKTLAMSKRLKAIIQRYNSLVKNNQLLVR